MKKLFVLEGPDCSGKSTLARALQKKTNGVIFHASGNKLLWPVMHEYHQSIIDNAFAVLEHHDVIIDRLWLSELVYHRVLRPHLERRYQWELLDAQIRGKQGLYITCYPDPGIYARYEKNIDPSHPYDMETFKRICTGYLIEFTTMHSRNDRFEYSVNFYNNNVDLAVKQILTLW